MSQVGSLGRKPMKNKIKQERFLFLNLYKDCVSNVAHNVVNDICFCSPVKRNRSCI